MQNLVQALKHQRMKVCVNVMKMKNFDFREEFHYASHLSQEYSSFYCTGLHATMNYSNFSFGQKWL